MRGAQDSGQVSWSFLLLALALLGGCVKDKKPAKSGEKKDDKPEIVQNIELGAGDTLVYASVDPKSPRSFSVRWQKGGFTATDGGVDTGHLETVSGDIFTNNVKSSEYQAPRGDAKASLKRLKLEGGVVLRSADGTRTMRADKAEYRGDVRLVRVIGNVTAGGPFGTLSGMPELWATPDLRLIGTPDMVSKTLKIPALLALAATATPGSARMQNGEEFRIQNVGPVQVVNQGARQTATLRPPGKGPIVILIPSRRLTFRLSGTVTLSYEAKGRLLRHLTAQGPVSVVQEAADGSRTTLDGSGADYDVQPGATTADLKLGGRVTLVNLTKSATGAQTATGKGDRMTAVLLAKPSAGGDMLRSATLIGNVTIESSGAGDGTFEGKGDRLIYTPGASNTDVVLSGHAVVTSRSKSTDEAGKAVVNTTVGRGEQASAVLETKSKAGQSPLKSAVLTGGVTIEVTGSNGQNFGGSGDRLVYTTQGDGGKVVMTGDLKFSGDAPEFLGSTSGADTATLVIGKSGWETIDLSNSGGKPTTTTIKKIGTKKAGTP